jgi:hypothetical protein
MLQSVALVCGSRKSTAAHLIVSFDYDLDLLTTLTGQPRISAQLFQILQQRHDDSLWVDQHDLLAWLLYIGGAFAPAGPVRSGYVQLLQQDYSRALQGLVGSWPDLVAVLTQFIWSEKVFPLRVKSF